MGHDLAPAQLRREADEQQHHFEVGLGDENIRRAIQPPRIEEELFPRHPVALEIGLAEDQAIMHVAVHQLAGFGIQADIVLDRRIPGGLRCHEPLEPATGEHLLRMAALPAIDQQIEVGLAGQRALDAPNALPMAVADTFALQRRQHADGSVQRALRPHLDGGRRGPLRSARGGNNGPARGTPVIAHARSHGKACAGRRVI